MLVAPLDMVKIRLQMQVTGIRVLYTSLSQAARHIFREEGIKTFWRGNSAAMCLWVAYSSLQLSAYDLLKREARASEWGRAHGDALHLLCGAGAGVFATAATYPFDLTRTTFASQGLPKQYPTVGSFLGHTLRTRGPAGLYRGVSPAVIQIVPYLGLHFLGYERLRGLGVPAGAAGFVAGGVSKLAVYPLDTIKKRLQADGLSRSAVPSYKGVQHCVELMLRGEGVRAFYRGLVPSIFKTATAAGATFAVYEAVRPAMLEGEVFGA